jgi:hypothetical protein
MTKMKTPYGPIYLSNPGPKKKYGNVNVYHQTASRDVILQGPALRAFRAAEARCATKKKKYILITGVGFRSWDLQYNYWKSDMGRYAHPDDSMHVEALAVDLDQSVGYFRLKMVERALKAEGWYPGAAFGDKPHWSFRVSG